MHLLRSYSIVALAFICVALSACASAGDNVNSGLWHFNAGLSGQAIPLLLQGVPALEASDPDDPRVPRGYVALGDLAVQDKKADLAGQFYGKALANVRAHQARTPSTVRSTLVSVGMYYLNTDRPADALKLLSEAAGISEREASIPRYLYAIDLDNVGVAQTALKNYAEAERFSASALRVLDTLEQSTDVKRAKGIVLFNLGYSVAQGSKDVEAEANYREALALVSAGGDRRRAKRIAEEYAKLLRKLDRPFEALQLEDQYK